MGVCYGPKSNGCFNRLIIHGGTTLHYILSFLENAITIGVYISRPKDAGKDYDIQCARKYSLTTTVRHGKTEFQYSFWLEQIITK